MIEEEDEGIVYRFHRDLDPERFDWAWRVTVEDNSEPCSYWYTLELAYGHATRLAATEKSAKICITECVIHKERMTDEAYAKHCDRGGEQD